MPTPTRADRLKAARRKLAGALRDALGELEAPLAPPGRDEVYRLECVKHHLIRSQALLIMAGSLVPPPANPLAEGAPNE